MRVVMRGGPVNTGAGQLLELPPKFTQLPLVINIVHGYCGCTWCKGVPGDIAQHVYHLEHVPNPPLFRYVGSYVPELIENNGQGGYEFLTSDSFTGPGQV